MTQNGPAFVVVLTTAPADLDVEPMARALLEARLVACVNVFPPMRSLYRWRGAIEAADERQLVMKTTAERVEALRDALAARHPYAVPEFLVLPVSAGSEAYLRWLGDETQLARD